MKSIRPEDAGVRSFYQYMTSAIAPRPIALVSTTDRSGNINLSPFSFFNYVGIDPPIIVFAPNKRASDDSYKDTVLNLKEVPEAVVNLVDGNMVQQVSLASSAYEKGINEFEKAGFTPVPSLAVAPPRVQESPGHLECRVLEIKEIGSMSLVIAEVVLAHFSERILDSKGRIDMLKTRWAGRAGGDWYIASGRESLFEVPRPAKGIGVDALPLSVQRSAILTGNELGILGSAAELPDQNDIRQYGYHALIASFREQTQGACENFNELLHIRVKELLAEGNVKEALLAAFQSH
ncbi:MAG: flavin reductase [Cytophagaceae bacterium SCN 52-12]|nr:MAG: flavin reductase [Cytophagaceae bacterium SCN 52-12]